MKLSARVLGISACIKQHPSVMLSSINLKLDLKVMEAKASYKLRWFCRFRWLKKLSLVQLDMFAFICEN